MSNSNGKKLLSSLLATAIGVTSLAASAASYAAEHNWRFANLYGRGTAYGEVYENLAKNIETMSNGRIEVQVLYSGEGVGTSGILSSVKSGLVTMGAPFQSMHAGELPAGVVEIGLPGGTADVGKLSTLFHEKGWSDTLKAAYGSQGMTWLDPYIQPAVYIISKTEIKSIEDFKGMKIRAPGAYGKFLRNLGASPVTLSWSEIYTSLATGVIDASIGSNMIDHRDGNHVEVAKFMYPLPLAGAQVLPIVVNTKEYNKLPEDLQAIVKAATTIHAQEQMTKSILWESQAVTEMEGKGLKWSPQPSEADTAAWKNAGQSLAKEYANQDKYSKQLVEQLESL
ncbi:MULTISPECIES: TRAP transporter substrate-binding protein [Vibrio]|uniref:TRAP transporter substrate-binding protein n=1 Tax=Vibrio qingdaonensis TaxID=2829491 RepID=A0A9X3CMY7_9VIBR|nr:TRAP transporter substrate-binding protein [Vibrio qingdaonensis]MCW8346397.1 TRAP transporter substrate-binding protein [Vibrio qingdaonensis]